jgi:uncharacterized protein YndB with AHSA1/START domain
MQTLLIKKSIEVNAPKEKVWEVLLNDKFTRIWYAEFMEGSKAETDWKVGSKAKFTDGKGEGIVGTVIENIPNKIISVEYQGIVAGGIEDYHSEIAQAVKGSRETYQLTEKDGVTHILVEVDMGEAYYEMMSVAWDKALEKIKTLAETN